MSERPILRGPVFEGREVRLYVSIKEHMSGCWWVEVVDTYHGDRRQVKTERVDQFYLLKSGDDDEDVEQAIKAANERADWRMRNS